MSAALRSARIAPSLRRTLGLEPKDTRDATVGFCTLLFAIAGHQMLEAARDGLFLQSLPPTRLPWAYLAIALLTFAGGALGRRAFRHVSQRRALGITLLGGTVITATFSFLPLARDSTVALTALYVWTGVFMTSVVVQFWLLASEVMDFGQAKRSFAVLGAGALVGAVSGALLASAALLVVRAQSLPALAAVMFLAAALMSQRFSVERSQLGGRARPRAPALPARELVQDVYSRRLFLLVLAGTIAATSSDYVFKTVVVREIARERLPAFFANYYAVLNTLALVVELVLTPRLMRLGGMHRLVLVMPLLVLSGSIGFALSGSLASILLLKGVDGSLRHSMNRIGTEILYLPLERELRQRIHVFIEAAGLRGGQALASLLVLTAGAFGLGERSLGYLLLGAAVIWALVALGIERPYIERFRSGLTRARPRTSAPAPELDLSSLEVLLKALSSTRQCEVLVALETFEVWRKTELVPISILYHPSDAVVLHALRAFSNSVRATKSSLDGAPSSSERYHALALGLLHGTSNDVAAAALRFCVRHAPDAGLFRRERASPSGGVRTTALIGLIRLGEIDEREAAATIQAIATGEDGESRRALGEGLPLLPATRWAWVLAQLTNAHDERAATLAATAIAQEPHPAFVPGLIQLLGPRETRSEARAALLSIGRAALEALRRSLADPLTPLATRRHLPRTISRFGGPLAFGTLERALHAERDEVVVFKILRGLCRMRRDEPSLPIDRALLRRMQWQFLGRAATLACWRHALARAERALPPTASVRFEILSRMVAEHEERALERIFRVLHIFEPTSSIVDVFEAVMGEDSDLRARGVELVMHLIRGAFGRALAAFLSELSLEARVARVPAAQLGPECVEILRLARQEREGLPDEALVAAALDACLTAMQRDGDRVLRNLAKHCGAHLTGATSELAHAS